MDTKEKLEQLLAGLSGTQNRLESQCKTKAVKENVEDLMAATAKYIAEQSLELKIKQFTHQKPSVEDIMQSSYIAGMTSIFSALGIILKNSTDGNHAG